MTGMKTKLYLTMVWTIVWIRIYRIQRFSG